MSVVIVDMNEKSLVKNNTLNNDSDVQNRLLPMSEYLSIAKKTIGRFAIPSLAKNMLNDEDAISFVAEQIMKGTIRWNPEKGRTLYSYHNMCAIWAIKRWILNKKVSEKHNIISLDKSLDNNDGDNLYNITEDKRVSKNNNTLPAFDEIISHGNLNEAQKQCLKMKFVDNMTYAAIGAELNKSAQRIEQIVKRAIEKLKDSKIPLNL